jgi:hypothetical protein
MDVQMDRKEIVCENDIWTEFAEDTVDRPYFVDGLSVSKKYGIY